MRIGVNTLFLVPGDVGGTEVYLRNTLSAMAALGTGDTLVLFTNRENDQLLRADLTDYPQVEFHQVGCRAAVRPYRIIAEQTLLPLAVRKQQVDVLWSPGYTAPAICFSPQVVTICDLQYKSFPEDMSGLERMTLAVLVRTACVRCQAVITISEFSRQEVINYKFAPGEKVHAIPLGVVNDFSQPEIDAVAVDESGQALKKQGIQRPFILCVAHTYPHKNVDKLVEAFTLLQEQEDIPHQLVLVGKSRRGENAVQESLAKMNNAGRVVRLSGLSDNELQTLYQEAEVFVLPSSYEGFGLPVVEAMMAGAPVVTVRMASLPEVGGEHAFYVDSPEPSLLAGKIMQVIELPMDQRNEQINHARQWAKGFTWKKTASQTMQVLQSVAEKR